MIGTAAASVSGSDTSPGTPDVRVARMANRIIVPAGQRDRAGTLGRLERALRDDVGRACAEALAGRLGDDRAVYRVRRLDLRLVIDAAELSPLAGRRVAERWGGLLARAIGQAIVRPGAQVLRFDSPAAYLTAFVRDLLEGRAWQRWCYDELRVLRPLGTRGAALHALATRPELIAETLVALRTTGHAERLIERLDHRDVERLWVAMGFGSSFAGSHDRGFDDVAATLVATPLRRATDPTSRSRDRLTLWTALVARRPDLTGDPGAAALVARLVDLAATLEAHPSLLPLLAMQTPMDRAVRHTITNGPLADIAGWLVPLAEREPALVARMAEATVPATTADRVEALRSPIGAVGLIVPALAEIGVWPAWCAAEGEDMARRYLFACLLQAIGRERALFALGDPLLAALAGLDEPPTADAREPLWVDRAPTWVDTIEGLPETAPDDTESAHLSLARIGFPWLAPSLERSLARVTRAAVRRTATRLPRFAHAGLVYLSRTFLAQGATLEIDPVSRPHSPQGRTITLRLDGGPAAFLLPMADFAEPVDIPWLDRPFAIVAGHLDGGLA